MIDMECVETVVISQDKYDTLLMKAHNYDLLRYEAQNLRDYMLTDMQKILLGVTKEEENE